MLNAADFVPLRNFDKDYKASTKSFEILNFAKFLKKFEKMRFLDSGEFIFELRNLYDGGIIVKKLRFRKGANGTFSGNFSENRRFQILIRENSVDFSIH